MKNQYRGGAWTVCIFKQEAWQERGGMFLREGGGGGGLITQCTLCNSHNFG